MLAETLGGLASAARLRHAVRLLAAAVPSPTWPLPAPRPLRRIVDPMSRLAAAASPELAVRPRLTPASPPGLRNRYGLVPPFSLKGRLRRQDICPLPSAPVGLSVRLAPRHGLEPR